MTTVENLTCHCKLLEKASGQKSQRESKKFCGQFSLVFLVSFMIWGKQNRDFFVSFVWKYRLSSKAEQSSFYVKAVGMKEKDPDAQEAGLPARGGESGRRPARFYGSQVVVMVMVTVVAGCLRNLKFL